jgi:hypothetical protein
LLTDSPFQDVNILIFDGNDPICTRAIRAELVSLIPRNFEERAQPIYFTGNPDNLIQVDIIPPDLVRSIETLLNLSSGSGRRLINALIAALSSC